MGAHTGTSRGQSRGSIHPEDGEGKAPRPADNTGHFPAALPSGHLPQRVQTTMTPLGLPGKLTWRACSHLPMPAPPPPPRSSPGVPRRPVLTLVLPAGRPSSSFHACSHSYPLSACRQGHLPVCPHLGLSYWAHARTPGTWGSRAIHPGLQRNLTPFHNNLPGWPSCRPRAERPHHTPSLSLMILVLRTQLPQRPPRG